MQLSRFGVRTVYGMGQVELYENVDHEDPEAILNGVSVSGLIGVLRQLGDLAESAAEIFQGIQEEVMATASRSNQLKMRLQHIEATVPPLEKAVLSQTTHLHFAYTGGVEWHPRILNEQNHFIHDDLPDSFMDPYEECRDPPRLHLLDKFDINGPGSCLKRYSDPTYFKRSSSNLIKGNNKFQNNNKSCIIKKKKSSLRSRDMSRLASMANQNARKTLTSFSLSRQTSSSKTASTSDMDKRSDVQDHHSPSFDSRSGSGYIECLSTETSSLNTGEKPKREFVSSSLTPGSCTIASVLSECETEDGKDSFQLSPLQGKAAVGSSCVSWDEKAEIVEPLSVQTDEASEMMEKNSVVDGVDEKVVYGEDTGRVENVKSEPELQQSTGIDEVREIKSGSENVREPRDSEHETESEGESFVDALNSIESESENDQGLKTSQQAVSSSCAVTDERLEKSVCEREIEQSSNSVEESCRSMDNGSVNATDEMNHQDPLEGTDNMACTFVPAPENSLSGSSNPLYHSEHQKSEAKVSREVEAIKIWTNGGLLGLNPSKPPVLEVPSSAEAEKDKSDDLAEHASHKPALDTSSLATQNLTVEQRECHETSYGVFGGLSQKLFTNSFRRRDSLSHDRQALPPTIPENNEVKTDKETSMVRFREEAPIDWFASSPPLQHMKISVNPVDTLHASRLKLKFSDEDNNINTFPSFQLLPETATSIHDSCSDDDTFCRSSPCTSDIDYLSDYHSLSNSEQWEEASDSHERQEKELDDSFHGSRHVDNNGEASSLDTEAENGCVALNFSYLQNPVEPLPPPFPPVQWMVSKTASETISDNKTTQSLQVQDALRFAFDKHTSSSIVSKEDPNTVTSAPKPEIKVHVKNNVREDKQNAKEKESEAGDFLEQIRTQHVNLRPVVMTTTLSAAAATTDPAINIKISAMLEKANSIRQAVASNDGDESDTWSDT